MSTQVWAVFTAAERAHALTIDDDAHFGIDPLPVSNANPGIGININPDAADFDPAEAVTLAGMFVAPKRMVDDPDCLTYCPALAAYMLTLPWAMLEHETIFAPPEPL